MEILKKVDGLSIAPISLGADLQNEILCQELPFKILKYPSLREHNGWIVPQKWEIIKAEIKKDGKLIYNGKNHALGVIGSAETFKGEVSLEQLKQHLFYKKDAPDNLVYHCDLYYKPYLKNWGFSVPYKFFKELKKGKYEINLQTEHTPGEMKVLEYEHQGKSDQTIIFNSHNCHAAQLNDGPAGYAVFIEVMKRLKGRKTKYNYRLVIAPEHLGTVFYLAGLDRKIIKNFKYGIFMEMVGHNDPLFSLQESFTGESLIDVIAHHILKFKNPKYRSDKFRKIVGNDETVWESPGYEIPMISLSRCKPGILYSQYHLNSDNFKIMKSERLEESVNLIMEIINVFEKNCYLKRKFTGLIALSNPKYDLYISPGTDPSIKSAVPLEQKKWNYLMDCLPRYFNGRTSILDIAIKHNLRFTVVYNYLLRFNQKDLIKFVD